MGKNNVTRREFLQKSVKTGTAVCLCTTLFHSCVATPKTHEETFSGYRQKTKNWDPVYGPPILRGTYGFNDFAGHLSHPIAKKYPGTDYELKIGTPIVGATKFILNYTGIEENAGAGFSLRVVLNESYRTGYWHLSKRIIGEKEKKAKLVINRNKIIGYSDVKLGTSYNL
jgi:hypothetical protein